MTVGPARQVGESGRARRCHSRGPLARVRSGEGHEVANARGAPDEQGLYIKITRMQFRWVDSGALAYFCGAPAKKRGSEPETKPVSNGNGVNGPEATLRWSGNWTGRDFISYLPSRTGMTLACGKPEYCDGWNLFEESSYPDFSIGSGNGRAITYGDLYLTRFQTNRGERNDGSTVFRGQQTRKFRGAEETGYCRGRSATGGNKYLDRFCMFGEQANCVVATPIRRRVYRKYSWFGGDVPPCRLNIGTPFGSGGVR